VLLFAILLGFTNAYSVAPAREWGGGLLAYVRLIVGALFLLPIMMVMDPLTYLSFGWWIGSGFMMWIFVWSLYRSIEQMGATKTLLILSIYPVVAVFASVLILKETLVDRQIIGGGLVVLGVCLLMKSRGAKNK
jgi:drug/metabolite transporter (DMT)-like permease